MCTNFLKVPETINSKTIFKNNESKRWNKKMSKSDASDLSRINLTDENDEILNKIKKAKTDPFPMPEEIKDLNKRPEAENLLGIYSSLKNQSLENSVKEFGGKQFSEFKEKLSESLIETIQPISREIKKLINDKKYLDEILLNGSEKADKIASKKIKDIKELVGF
jgi:tryptophanyl-tRNA synthetase